MRRRLVGGGQRCGGECQDGWRLDRIPWSETVLRACLDLTERLQGIGELERNVNDGRCIESWTKFSWVMGQVAQPLP